MTSELVGSCSEILAMSGLKSCAFYLIDVGKEIHIENWCTVVHFHELHSTKPTKASDL